MCLFIFSNIGACLKGCGNSLAACCRSLNPIALLLSLVACPVSFFIVLLWGFGAALFKLPSGTYYHERLMWTHYCSVLKTGKRAYDGKSKKNSCEDCCDSCLAELYCCGAPVMLAIAVFYPFLLLILLLFTAVSYAFRGLCAGAIRKDLKLDAWWPGVRNVIIECDRETSRLGYESERGLLCANGELCNDGDDFHRQQELPGPHNQQGMAGIHTGPGAGGGNFCGSGMAAAHPQSQQFGVPQPQVMAQAAVPVARVVPGCQPAYAPQHAQQAYVPTAQPAIPISQGYPTAQPAYGGPAQPPPPPPPPPPQSAAASAATTAGGFMSALGKAALTAASAVEKEGQRQREAKARQDARR